MSFWCVYPIFNWGNIVSKKCDQKYGVQRKNKTGEGGGHIGELPIEGGFKCFIRHKKTPQDHYIGEVSQIYFC